MALLDDLKSKTYWMEVVKMGMIFFVLFTFFSLLILHFSKVLSGEFSAIYEQEWAHGKWQRDLLVKAVISLVYAMYMVSRRGRFGPKKQ